MKVLDKGHDYELDVLDGDFKIQLTFVKRKGEKYPGNLDDYPGTNLQEVIRALIDRCIYLNEQIPCLETQSVIGHLRSALIQLELRAARRHGRTLEIWTNYIETIETCKRCGHIGCQGHCEKTA